MNWKFGPVHDTILKEGNFVPVRVLARGNRGGGGGVNYGMEGKMLWRLVKYPYYFGCGAHLFAKLRSVSSSYFLLYSTVLIVLIAPPPRQIIWRIWMPLTQRFLDRQAITAGKFD